MILIFFPYGIGDVIMAIPGLRRLCEKFEPKEIVVILANKVQEEALLTLLGLPIQTLIFNQKEFFGSLKLYFKILFLKPKIIYAPMINNFKSRILFFLLLNKKTYVPHKVLKSRIFNLYPAKDSLESFNGHEVNYLINFFNLGHDKIETKHARPIEFKLSNFQDIKLSLSPSRYKIVVGISCGIAERHKIPSPLIFAQLLNQLSKRIPCNFYLMGSSSDVNLIESLIDLLDDDASYELRINNSINETLNDMKNYDLGISGTTGQGHMMSVVDLPVLILSGVTDPRESGPYVSRAAIIKHDFSCGPCYQATFKYGCKKISCMDTLDISLAVDQAVKLLHDENFGSNWLQAEERKVPTSIFQIQQFLKSQGIQYP